MGGDDLLVDPLPRHQPTGDEALDDLCARYWRSMTTARRRGHVMEMVNIRLWDGRAIADQEADRALAGGVWAKLARMWRELTCRVKINCSIGCILEHKTTGELRYFHASSNNAALFDNSRLVSSERALRAVYRDFTDLDLVQNGFHRRPDTAWRLRAITNVSFYFYKILGMGKVCLLYTSPSPRDRQKSRMPSSA